MSLIDHARDYLERFSTARLLALASVSILGFVAIDQSGIGWIARVVCAVILSPCVGFPIGIVLRRALHLYDD